METMNIEAEAKKARKFLPVDMKVTTWQALEPFFNDLKERKTGSLKELEKWMRDRSELEAALDEDLAWRYIRMNINTADEQLSEAFNFFVNEISPKLASYGNEFDKKLIASPFLKELDKEKYRIYLRSVKKQIEIFREENIPLLTQLQKDSQKYGIICGKMMVEIDGKEVTMHKAAAFLKDTDRKKREDVFRKMCERRAKDVNELNELMTHLIKLRHQVALNAGFANYRDYMFASLGRFDYTVQDCYNFQDSIRKEIVPLIVEFNKERKAKLELDRLRPWDTEVDITGKPPLKPFEDAKELTEKTIHCFKKIRPYFGECLYTMKEMGYLDLESKPGKAPGGFLYPLHETGVPFIFMNAVGTLRDLVTIVHEGGHAIHSFLSHPLELHEFKSTPSEVAELASMSMELISMEHWYFFFTNPDELNRAKKEQLEKILSILPWIATVDKFQHWLYENPEHTVDERTKKWVDISKEFSTNVVDWKDFENEYSLRWQQQLHIYEVPFYYIEYGMAQLGAIAMWKNYKENPANALEHYEAALKLGYTRTIGEIYQTAGILFDFSGGYVKELADFVKSVNMEMTNNAK